MGALRHADRRRRRHDGPVDEVARGGGARLAGAGDAAGITAVHIAGWQAGYRGLLPQAFLDALSEPATVAQRTAQWTHALEQGRRVAVADDAEGQVVAFAITMASRDGDAGSGVGEVPAIYCHPDAWGAGHGRAVHDAALTELREAGYEEVTLWVLAGNERARAFYARQGWHLDPGPGGLKHDQVAGATVQEIRYRRALA